MAEQTPIDTYYYLAAWTDEVMPCGPTLDEWADWLSRPDPDWNRAEAAADGQEFVASVLAVLANLTATFTDGRWTCEDPPAAAADIFVRYAGEDSGWCPDDSTYFTPTFGEDPDRDAARARMMAAITNAWSQVDEGENCIVACTAWQGDVRLRFDLTADGPRLTVLGAIQ